MESAIHANLLTLLLCLPTPHPYTSMAWQRHLAPPQALSHTHTHKHTHTHTHTHTYTHTHTHTHTHTRIQVCVSTYSDSRSDVPDGCPIKSLTWCANHLNSRGLALLKVIAKIEEYLCYGEEQGKRKVNPDILRFSQSLSRCVPSRAISSSQVHTHTHTHMLYRRKVASSLP